MANVNKMTNFIETYFFRTLIAFNSVIAPQVVCQVVYQVVVYHDYI